MTLAGALEGHIAALDARGTKARLACEQILESALAVGRSELTPNEYAEYRRHEAEFCQAGREVDALADELERLNKAAS